MLHGTQVSSKIVALWIAMLKDTGKCVAILTLVQLVNPARTEEQQCKTTIDCVKLAANPVCAYGICMTITESTGIDGWVYGTITIGVILMVHIFNAIMFS